MMTIWKYTLQDVDTQKVVLPAGSDVISAQEQKGRIHVWAIFDKSQARVEERTFQIVGTGDLINDDRVKGNLFVGTVQIGRLVQHVFVSRNRG